MVRAQGQRWRPWNGDPFLFQGSRSRRPYWLLGFPEQLLSPLVPIWDLLGNKFEGPGPDRLQKDLSQGSDGCFVLFCFLPGIELGSLRFRGRRQNHGANPRPGDCSFVVSKVGLIRMWQRAGVEFGNCRTWSFHYMELALRNCLDRSFNQILCEVPLKLHC